MVLVAAPLLGAAAAYDLRLGLGGLVGVLLVLLVARYPWSALALHLGVTPLVVGIDRGAVLPWVRPNEVLLGLLLAGLAVGPLRRWWTGARRLPELHPLDLAVASLAVLGSVVPVLWLWGRGRAVEADDIAFALVLVKYAAVYVMFRLVTTTVPQRERLLVVAIGASAVVAVVGVLQALGVPGVAAALSPYASAEDQHALSINKASTTIGTPIGYADVMVLAAALCVGLATGARRPRLAAVGVAFFALACLASGQASGLVALVLGMCVAGLAVGRLRLLVGVGTPFAVLAVALLSPVLRTRLAGLDPATGLPLSWTGPDGRLANLRRYVLPELLEGHSWIMGVRPASRIDTPSEPWRDWLWIESGYAWLLWSGGVPLLAAFVVYVTLLWRTARAGVRLSEGPDRAVAVAALVGAALLAVLMVLDQHVALRGSADLLFPLVGLLAAGDVRRRDSQAPRRAHHLSRPAA